MSEARNYSPQQVAQMARDFLTTPFGEYFIEVLSLKYNQLHQQAEDETISAERKAFMIERSAGIKLAINYLIERRDALDAGLVPEDKKD